MQGKKAWIKHEIDNEKTVELIVDYYFLPTSIHYRKNHFMHEILITGYIDDQYVVYWDYVNHIYKENKCRWDEIQIYDSETFYGDGVAGKIYKSKKASFLLDPENIRTQIIDYLNSANPYTNIAIWGDYELYKDCIYGIESIRVLVKEIIAHEKIDIRYLSVLYEHKKLMCKRLKILQGMTEEEWCYKLIPFYNRLSEDWRKLLYISVKDSFKSIGEFKKNALVEEIKELYEIEKSALSEVLG